MIEGELVCSKCHAEFRHPTRLVYEYKEVSKFYTHLPSLKIGYCLDCKKFVCIQKGIKYKDIVNSFFTAKPEAKDSYKNLMYLMQGKDSIDCCTECSGTSLIEEEQFACPICKEGIMKHIPYQGTTRFRLAKKYITPKLVEKEKCNCLNDTERTTRNDMRTTDLNKGNAKGSNPMNKESLKKKHEERKNFSPFVDILKWIGVLPISIVSWILAFWVINLLYKIFSPVEMTQWAITIMSSGGSGMAFVLSGSWLAPKGKKIVSIVLATIMCVFALVSLVFALSGYGENSTMISVLACISTIAGCAFGSIQMYGNKMYR